MKIIHVIPLKKGIWKDNLTYFTGLDTSPGNIVSIFVRNKKTLGLVISVEELKEEKSNIKNMNFNLRKVFENKGNSIFLKEFIESVFETGKYFAQNKNLAITSLIPKIFIEEYDKIATIEKKGERNVKNIDEVKIKTEKLLFQYPKEERISIYKTLIRESFAKGKSIFIVVPTELDIKKFEENLAKGIEQFTFAMHSSINPKKNLLAYQKIITSTHPVLLIGTAPFLSIPRRDIGTIILEHEGSPSYKMIARPYFDLRTFVEIFASKINAKFVMADDLLNFETINRREMNNLNTLYPMSFRIDYKGRIEIIAKNSKEKISEDKKFKILEDSIVEEIKTTIQKKGNVFIFSLRKGLATMTVCRDCGDTVMCKECGSTLVLYTSALGTKKMFVCNKCNTEKDANTKCSSCGSWNLIPLGIGTDTVYEYLKDKFPTEIKRKILKLDKESAKSASGAKKIIEEFENLNGAILVGTEMALLYMKNKVPLSIIASFDSLWSIPNFKMGEKIIRIMLAIMSKTEDKFIIQTKNENDTAIQAIQKENLLSFVRKELEDREKLEYPPFKRFIKINYLGDKEETRKTKEVLKEVFKEYNPEIFSSFIPKMKGKYSTNMLIKLDPQKWTWPSISPGGSIDERLLAKLSTLPPTFQVFVDPEDLL